MGQVVSWTEFNYSTLYHSSIQRRAFEEVVYGRQLPPLLPYESGMAIVGEVDNLLKERDDILREFKATLQPTQ